MVNAVEWRNGKVFILDQRLLPLEIKYIECTDYRVVAEAIKNLSIRGAPAIGIASAMGVALSAQDQNTSYFDGFYRFIKKVMDTMISTRPTAVNIEWAMKRLDKLLIDNADKDVNTLKRLLYEEAMLIHREDIEANLKIGQYGAEFIKDGDTILTHCNAGSLATGGYGTATAPMIIAKQQGKKIKVIADETRPVLQGARLTAWELMQNDIDATLITDNSAGWLMKQGMIDMAIVGTDRTTLNGDVANKIGTYTVAVLCKEHNIPFYVAAPISSIDFNMSSGDMIRIEQRDPEEVAYIQGQRIAPEGVKIFNYAFDVTPARYVTAFFTEKGVFKPEELRGIRI
ncbi:MAG TPA: S-methyl-5-thioribose-1-phosphate isomerase [Nitrospirae bacterium]|nr:S-methyl-5-thioribose-1-phosphate isomerase [Nitrospirota bacterium]